ncbi:MAG: outer membrane protein assembly factor BamC [Burkholderiaceae bacterium]|jgi:outer membrane protein assembly factor BamC|nr:outer membrane protein assembly factor BamC [Burkholderiaceae bacterium]
MFNAVGSGVSSHQTGPRAACRRRRSSVLTAAVLASVLLAAGCSSLGLSSDKIDYKSVQPQRALDLPPDLSSVPANDRFAVPGVATASGVAQQGGAQRPAAGAGSAVATVAPTSSVARIERAGAQRFLAVDLPPEQAYAVVRDFWPSVGLKLERDDAALGIVETVWAENRAKLPQDIIRRTIGRVFDGLYSTGEQDKFRTRIERTAKNTSEIYISHRGMIEVYSSAQKDQTRWQPRDADPELEAEMLQRLLLRFAPQTTTAAATPAATAASAPAAAIATGATAAAPAAAVTQAVRVMPGSDGRAARLEIDEAFDRAWRRVGVGLDRGGFTVEDRDRTNGVYFVRYLDPDVEAKQRAEQGFFSKIFGSDPKIVAQQFRIQVGSTAASGSTSTVSVLNKDGKPESSSTSDKILRQLAEQIR